MENWGTWWRCTSAPSGHLDSVEHKASGLQWGKEITLNEERGLSGDMRGGPGGTSSQAILLRGLLVRLLREKQPPSLSPSPGPEQAQAPPGPDMEEGPDRKFHVTAALSQASFLAQFLRVPRWGHSLPSWEQRVGGEHSGRSKRWPGRPLPPHGPSLLVPLPGFGRYSLGPPPSLRCL